MRQSWSTTSSSLLVHPHTWPKYVHTWFIQLESFSIRDASQILGLSETDLHFSDHGRLSLRKGKKNPSVRLPAKTKSGYFSASRYFEFSAVLCPSLEDPTFVCGNFTMLLYGTILGSFMPRLISISRLGVGGGFRTFNPMEFSMFINLFWVWKQNCHPLNPMRKRQFGLLKPQHITQFSAPWYQ